MLLTRTTTLADYSSIPTRSKANPNGLSYTNKNYRHVPFDQMGGFVGRIDELERLKQKIFETNGRRIVSVLGLGGVGKSRVALLTPKVLESVTRFEPSPDRVFIARISTVYGAFASFTSVRPSSCSIFSSTTFKDSI